MADANRSAVTTELLHWVAEHPRPEPVNGLVASAVSAIASVVATNRVAAYLEDRDLAEQVHAAANAALAELIDDFCGTPPRPHHLGITIAVDLVRIAEAMVDGPARADFVAAGRAAAMKSFGDSPTASDPMPALEARIVLAGR